MTSMLYCWVSDVKIGFSMKNAFCSVTHTKLLYSAMNTCNIAHNVKFMVLFLDSHEHNGYYTFRLLYDYFTQMYQFIF